MNYEDLSALEDQSLVRDFERFSDFNGICAFDNLVPLPIECIALSYDLEDDIEIYDNSNNLIGYLCGCKKLGEVDFNQITDQKYVAYINEVAKEYLGLPYKFEHDYVVVFTHQYENYKNNYLESAPIWGGFCHPAPPTGLAYKNYKPSKLFAVPNIDIPTSHHKESCARSVKQPYAFERFLKLYHLLELYYDWYLVEEIKRLSPNLLGIGDLLNRYRDRDEVASLKNILELKCQNTSSLEGALNKIAPSYISKGEKIFYDYGKSSNPLKDKQQFLDLMNLGGFTISNVQSIVNKQMKPDAYLSLLVKVSAYWIYRVRCSIAHSRIGEYIMDSLDDEEFVVEFAEPLLRQVIYQVFKR